MSSYNHTAVNQRDGHGAAPVSITGQLAKGATGSVASVTCTALPDIEDDVQVWDGPLCIASLYFRKSDDAGKVNVAQTISKAYGDRGLQLHVLSGGGKTGAYTVSYT